MFSFLAISVMSSLSNSLSQILAGSHLLSPAIQDRFLVARGSCKLLANPARGSLSMTRWIKKQGPCQGGSERIWYSHQYKNQLLIIRRAKKESEPKQGSRILAGSACRREGRDRMPEIHQSMSMPDNICHLVRPPPLPLAPHRILLVSSCDSTLAFQLEFG